MGLRRSARRCRYFHKALTRGIVRGVNFGITVPRVFRYALNGFFLPKLKPRIMNLCRPPFFLNKEVVLSRAREIFGDPCKTWSWLTTTNHNLRDMSPKDLIEYGNVDDLNMVLAELNRIDQGLF